MEHTPSPYEVTPPPGPERRRKVLSLEWLKKWRKSRESGEVVAGLDNAEPPKRMARKVLEVLGIRRRHKDEGPEAAGSIQSETEAKSFIGRLRERGRSLLRLADRVEHTVLESYLPEERAAAIAEVAPVTSAAEKLDGALNELDEVVKGDDTQVEWSGEATGGDAPVAVEYGSDVPIEKPISGKTIDVSAPITAVTATAIAAGVPFIGRSSEARYQDLKDRQKKSAQRIRAQEKVIAEQGRAIDHLEAQSVNYTNEVERRSYIEKVAQITHKQAEVTHEVATDLRAQKQTELAGQQEVFRIPRTPNAERAPQPLTHTEVGPHAINEQLEQPPQSTVEAQPLPQKPEEAPIIAPEKDDGRIERNIYTHDQQTTDGGVRMGGAALSTTTLADTSRDPQHDTADTTRHTAHMHRPRTLMPLTTGQKWLYAATLITAALAIIGAVLAII